MENTSPESPVIVHTSPLSSPVFVNSRVNENGAINGESNDSKCQEIVELLETTMFPLIGLDLPTLDESLIKVIVENKPNDESKVETGVSKNDSPIVEESKKSEKEVEKKATELIKDFKYCQEEFQRQIKSNNIEISPETIMKLLRIAMIIVEQTKETGENKKKFVIKLLNELFTNDNINTLVQHNVEALNLISSNLVSDTIDFIVDASKGKLDVNKAQVMAENVAKSCFSQCLSRLFKRS